MPQPENQKSELIIVDVIDDAVVANSNAKFPFSTFQLNTSRRSWVISEIFDSVCESMRHLRMKCPKSLRCFSGDLNFVCHKQLLLQTELVHQFVEGNARFCARCCCCANICLVLQCFHCAIKELGRNYYSTAPCTA